jgi:opacity protein-like surface antigen
MQKTLVLAAALALAGLSNAAFAADGSGFIRGEIGRSHVNVDVSGLGSDSDTDTNYSFRGGYWFNSNFAIEGFYSNLYDKSFTDGVDTADAKLSAIGLGVVAKKNFGADGNGFFIDGRAGITRGKIDLSVSGLGSDSATSTKPYFGAGIGYDFSKNFGLSLNYDHLKGSGDDISVTANTLTLGAEFRF